MFRSWLGSIVAVSIPITGSGLIHAQAQSAREPAPDDIIEEIIVLARKREEGLQDAPISISAFSASSLAARGITKIDEIQNVTPNLSFYGESAIGAAANSASVFLRGIGQNDFVPTAEPGVGLYVDGVYYGRSVGSVWNLIDVERVEVLRGPQGTLFGRNSIGGVVAVVSKKPGDILGLDAGVTVGTDDRLDATLTVNTPITENLAAKVSAAKFTRDGYVTNTVTGQELGDEDTVAARAALRWIATPYLSLDVSLDYSDDRSNGIPYINDGTVFLDPTQPGGPNFSFISNVLATPLTGCDGTFANPAGSLTNPGCLNDQYKGANGGLGDFHSNVESSGASVSVDWTVTDSLQLKSITAYRQIDADFAYDGDASPIFIVDGIHDVMTQDQITQELQLLGPSDQTKLRWILGLYYFQEDGEDINPVDFLPVSLTSGGLYDNKSVAAFGQGTYQLTEKLQLTGGIRYTEDTKRFLPDEVVTGGLVTLGIPGFPFIPIGTRVLPFVEVATKADDWTPLVNLAYEWSAQLTTYITYSEGFKGGGFHQRVFPPLPATPTFEPEFASSYELGFKYSAPSRRLVLNGSVFYTDYENLQVTVFTAIAPVLDNAGNAKISGFELETRWIPADRWLVEAGVGYLDTGYKDVLPATGLTGNEKLPFVPEWSSSASVTKEFLLGDRGTLKPRLDWSYRSEIQYDTFNTPFIVGESYHLWNASVAWLSPSARYGVILRAENIADERYARRRVFSAGFGNILDCIDRGRVWSVAVNASF
jgi:iron complex outermembrane receptor protein